MISVDKRHTRSEKNKQVSELHIYKSVLSTYFKLHFRYRYRFRIIQERRLDFGSKVIYWISSLMRASQINDPSRTYYVDPVCLNQKFILGMVQYSLSVSQNCLPRFLTLISPILV